MLRLRLRSLKHEVSQAVQNWQSGFVEAWHAKSSEGGVDFSRLHLLTLDNTLSPVRTTALRILGASWVGGWRSHCQAQVRGCSGDQETLTQSRGCL